MDKINQIYDRIFKKILTLSSKSVVNLINALFSTDYPSDAVVHYNWTEFHDDKLKKILADTIITINGKYCYHIEAQTYEDGTIVFRVFEYGYRHAERNRINNEVENRLVFPEPVILYIYADGEIPDTCELILDFGTQGSFRYKVPTVQLKDISVEELNDRKMVILIPFYLMSLRKTLTKARTPENLERLKKLIFGDIIGSIQKNLELDNITREDADRLRQMTQLLYHHLYAHYEELEEVSDMTDESLLLPYDLFIRKYNIDNLYETLDRVEHLDEEEQNLRKAQEKLKQERQNFEQEQQNFQQEQQSFEQEQQSFQQEQQSFEQEQQSFQQEQQNFQQERQSFRQKQIELQQDKQQLEEQREQLIRDSLVFLKMQNLNENQICEWLVEQYGLTSDEMKKYQL